MMFPSVVASLRSPFLRGSMRARRAPCAIAILGLVALILPSGGGLVGCVSQHGDRGDVIERSAEQRPLWAEGKDANEGTAEVTVLFRKEGLTRLELGIKQTQAAGMEQGCTLLQERMKGELTEHARQAGVASEALSNAASAALARLKSDGRCPDLAPKFVYWELLRKDTAEGSRQAYDVYVLLATKKRQYLDALSSVVDTIRTSGAPGADALATAVAESYDP